MTLIRRNFNVVLTLALIICNHAHGISTRDLQNGGGQLLTPTTKGPRPPPFAPMHVQSDTENNGDGGPHTHARTISVNTNNLNNLLNKNPAQSLNEAVNSQGIVSSINAIKTDLDNLSQQFNIFKFIDIFINQTRQSIPLMATKGNFTLLQAALLCAVGSMTAGAAIIAAEAFYFRKHNEQEFYYHLHEQEHAQHAHAQAQYGKLPSLTYGHGAMHKSALERSDEDGAAVPKVRELQGRSQSLPGGSSTMSPEKLAEYYQRELKRMNKPQSLKRNQRRRQRKNKNSPNMMGGTRPGAPAQNGRARVKRQAPDPAGTPMAPDRPNSFNQFLLHPDQRRDVANETDTPIEQAAPPPQTPSPPIQPPVFWGPRAPQQPLPLPVQQKRPEAAEFEGEIHARPQPPPDTQFPLIPRPNPSGWSSMFDFISMLKNAMDYLMNYIFDRNGGHATSQNQRLGFGIPNGRVKREANETDQNSSNQTGIPPQEQVSETEIQAATAQPPPNSVVAAPNRKPTTTGISSWLPQLDYVLIFKNTMTFLLNFIFEQNGGYASKLNLGSGFGQQQSPLGLRFPKLNPNHSFIPKVWGNNIRKS